MLRDLSSTLPLIITHPETKQTIIIFKEGLNGAITVITDDADTINHKLPAILLVLYWLFYYFEVHDEIGANYYHMQTSPYNQTRDLLIGTNQS